MDPEAFAGMIVGDSYLLGGNELALVMRWMLRETPAGPLRFYLVAEGHALYECWEKEGPVG